MSENIPAVSPEFGCTITYDGQAGAIYIQLGKKENVVKSMPINEFVIFDLDEGDFPVGIEILNAGKYVKAFQDKSARQLANATEYVKQK